MKMKTAAFSTEVHTHQVFNALSMALDIAEGAKTSHAKRVAYISLRLAMCFNLTQDQLENIYYSALMHDIGVCGSRKDYMDREAAVYAHCLNGSNIVKRLAIGSCVCRAIQYHHENWDGSGPFKLKGHDIPLDAQIIHLANYFDTTFHTQEFYTEIRERAISELTKSKGSIFSPKLVDIFIEMVEEERFWLDCQLTDFDTALNRVVPKSTLILDLNTFENIAEVFAAIIDNHSEFTYRHSLGIAEKIKQVTIALNYDGSTVKKAYIAGLLHDIGKLAVPPSILNKPGPLTSYERSVINTHSYYTKLILGSIPGIEDVCRWASNHHERLDGKGYPERMSGQQLEEIERLMCVCDIYQALTEDRPYRNGLEPLEAWNIIREMVEDGALCGQAAEIVKKIV